MEHPRIVGVLVLFAPLLGLALIFGGLLGLSGKFGESNWVGRAANKVLDWLPRAAAYVTMVWALWGIWTIDDHDLRLFCTVGGFILAGWILRLQKQRDHYRHLAELYRRQLAGESVENEIRVAVMWERADHLDED